MFKGKKILVTGGTGSLGQSLTKRLLETELQIQLEFLVEMKVNRLKWNQNLIMDV